MLTANQLLTQSAILWHDLGMPTTVKHDRNVPNRVLIDFDTRVVAVPYAEIPALITALRRAYNARPGQQSQADGVVASVLLQSAVAEAPGDFS